MSLLFADPCKLSLKEVENIITTYHLEDDLPNLLAEINRVNYDGYIKLSKPKDYYSREDWEKILTELQNNILQVKAQPENKPLPVFLEKLLRRILDSDDLEGFRRFLNTSAQYLPEELINVKDNQQFIKWVFSKLKSNILILEQSSLRLSPHAKPEDIGF
ncbi:MAG: hypothetical protein ACOX1Y_09640 [Zhaonellaceae bacterium]|mgnify:CR=1 FL=1|nr:hypothetical protein [Clostridia bacterium]